jgi:hypothetical protein
MSDRCIITMPDDCYAAVLDAIQRTVTDKCASKATRKAAFSALLALVEGAGYQARRRSVRLRRVRAPPSKPGRSRAYFGRRYRFAFSSRRKFPSPKPSVLATRSLVSFHLSSSRGGGPCRHRQAASGLPFERHRPAVRRKPESRRTNSFTKFGDIECGQIF